MISWSVWLIPISFAAGNVFKISLFSPQIRISILDIAVILLIILGLPELLRKKKQALQSFKVWLKPLVIFLIFSLLTLVVSGKEFGLEAQLVGLSYWIRFLAYSILPLFLFNLFSTVQMKRMLISCGFLIVLGGLLQYFLLPDTRFIKFYGWDDHYYRVLGQFLDPGFAGLMFVLSLVYLAVNPLRNPQFNFLLWSASYLGLALTYSRSSFLAFLFSMAAISYYRRSLAVIVLSLLLIAGTVYHLPRASDGEGVKLERTGSITARADSWNTGWSIFIHRPLFGVGFNTYRFAQNQAGYLTGVNWQTTHSGSAPDASLLFVAATTGILGFLLYLWYLSGMFSLFSPVINTSLVGIIVHSFFLNSLFYPFVLVWLALLTALEPNS